MNAILAIPEIVRLIGLLLLGAAVGAAVNWAIYAWAYNSRSYSPWSAPHPKALRRRWHDRLPIFGWLTVSREEELHGAGYWIRPLCIELFCAGGAVALYLWETGGGLKPDFPGVSAPPVLLHSVFLAHLLLIPLMLVATFIDIDEQLIPDQITIPGTFLGLLVAACMPMAALPIAAQTGVAVVELVPLRLIAPPQALGAANFLQATWPEWLDGAGGLAVGLACWWGWYVVVVPKTIWWRGGAARAVRFMVASIRRYRPSLWITAAVVLATPAIVGVWWLGGSHWESLLTALVGMAFGGGLIWAVRIIGTAALKKEAMGFGDVTLMAMIGAFLGWQACLIAFFLSPFAALAIALPQKLLKGETHIAFGPFLCLASLVTMLAWPELWERWGRPAFGMGWLIPGLLAACLFFLGLLLGLWHLVETRRK